MKFDTESMAGFNFIVIAFLGGILENIFTHLKKEKVLKLLVYYWGIIEVFVLTIIF